MKPFLYCVWLDAEVLSFGVVLARDERHATVLTGQMVHRDNAGRLADEDLRRVEVAVRPF